MFNHLRPILAAIPARYRCKMNRLFLPIWAPFGPFPKLGSSATTAPSLLDILVRVASLSASARSDPVRTVEFDAFW